MTLTAFVQLLTLSSMTSGALWSVWYSFFGKRARYQKRKHEREATKKARQEIAEIQKRIAPQPKPYTGLEPTSWCPRCDRIRPLSWMAWDIDGDDYACFKCRMRMTPGLAAAFIYVCGLATEYAEILAAGKTPLGVTVNGWPAWATQTIEHPIEDGWGNNRGDDKVNTWQTRSTRRYPLADGYQREAEKHERGCQCSTCERAKETFTEAISNMYDTVIRAVDEGRYTELTDEQIENLREAERQRDDMPRTSSFDAAFGGLLMSTDAQSWQEAYTEYNRRQRESNTATPEYEAGIQRRARDRELREKYKMDEPPKPPRSRCERDYS